MCGSVRAWEKVQKHLTGTHKTLQTCNVEMKWEWWYLQNKPSPLSQDWISHLTLLMLVPGMSCLCKQCLFVLRFYGSVNQMGPCWVQSVYLTTLFFFFFFFFFDLGFTALSRIFHLYRADRSSKVGENRSTRRKTTWPSVSRTWLSHIWPELDSNHGGEKPNGLRVNSLIH